MTHTPTTDRPAREPPDADLTRVPRLHLVRTRCSPEPTALPGTGSRDECAPDGRPHSEANLEALRASATLRKRTLCARTAPPNAADALVAALVAAATGAFLTGPWQAVAGGSTGPRTPNLPQPGHRSVVVGATVVALAALDLPGRRRCPPSQPPPVVTPPPPPPSPPPSPLGGVWAELRRCESGDDYAIDTGNGYYGAYQFSAATWHGLGFAGLPNQAPPAFQDEAAVELQARSGWGQWPACSRRLGLEARRREARPRLPTELLIQPVEGDLGREADVVGPDRRSLCSTDDLPLGTRVGAIQTTAGPDRQGNLDAATVLVDEAVASGPGW